MEQKCEKSKIFYESLKKTKNPKISKDKEHEEFDESTKSAKLRT